MQSSQSQPISAFLTSPETSLDDAVTRAEVYFTGFLVEHNVPLAASDHASKLFKKMFDQPGHNPRDILKRYSSGRTKSTHIMQELAAGKQEPLISYMKKAPFSISTDGSNDRHSSDKPYPLIVTCATDLESGEVKNHLLCIPNLKEAGTGQNIFRLIDNTLSAYDIPWRNCICFGSDNASVMIGKRNGVLGNMMTKHEDIYSSGCVCHLIHLAAEWAAKELPISTENFFQDLYYYMDKSSKRVSEFEALQEELDVVPHKICKHGATRWLSLGKSIKWLLEQWEVVKQFFKSECEKSQQKSSSKSAESKAGSSKESKGSSYTSDRKEHVLKDIRSRTFKLYIFFLDFVLPTFDIPNVMLQSEKPMVHKQKHVMSVLLRDLMVKFVKPVSMRAKKLTEVDLTKAINLKSGKDIMIGEKAEQWIHESGLPQKAVEDFYQSVLKFFQTACQYIIKKFPIDSPVLHHAQVADITQRDKASVESIKYFLQRFPCMVPAGGSKDKLESEFCLYQIEDIPADVMTMDRADHQWNAIGNIKDISGKQKYCYLHIFMKFILSISHSNASCERIFSLVRKNKTDFRCSLGQKSLESLLILKQSRDVCHNMAVTPDLIKRCKGATSAALSKSDS